MNIIEAARAMREGKRVRRKSDDDGAFLRLHEDGESAMNQLDRRESLRIDDLLADDWEIVEGEG